MKLQKMLPIIGISLLLGVAGQSLAQTPCIVQAAEETTPISVTMSQESGVYEDAFTLTLTSEEDNEIYYTLDGSNPVTSKTRIKYENGISISDRSNDENYVSAVDPLLFDSANVAWDAKSGTYKTGQTAPKKEDVDKGTVVKAVATDAAGSYGTVETNTYFVGTVAQHIQGAKESAEAAGIPLSVISISIDYDDLFDYEKGIYVKGKVFDDALAAYLAANPSLPSDVMEDAARRLPANYASKGKDWERGAHIDYFETDGKTLACELQQDCGIRIQGNYSRSDLMKSFRLYARADYGKKNFKYPFFADAKDNKGKTIEKYKKLVLRNGGNYAFYGTKYNDTYWQSLLADLDCETQSSRACVVYIDGEYWGLYVLQQDYDDNYFEITHGVNKDAVVVYKASDAAEDAEYGYKLDEGNLPEGVTETEYFYKDLLEFFATHTHLQKEEDYQEFIKLVDPQSVMDYFAVNVWVNNKWDWPGKNWSMWKTAETDPENKYADGRWRFCFYDLDFGGCGGEGEIYTNTMREDNYNSNGLLGQNLGGPVNPAVQCFILLMTNENFREDYKTELGELSDTVFEKNRAVEKLNVFQGTYDPLFAQFYKRYNITNDYTYGYAGYNNLKSFVQGREAGIAVNVQFIDDIFENYDYSGPTVSPSPSPTPTPSPTPDPETSPVPESSALPAPEVSASPDAGTGVAQVPGTIVSPTPDTIEEPDDGTEGGGDEGLIPDGKTKKKIKKLTINARKNKKTIQIKTIAKGKTTVTLSKKIIVKGKKKVKKITVTASKKGIVKIKLSKKLAKGMKVTVQVKKKGYTTKKKTLKIR